MHLLICGRSVFAEVCFVYAKRGMKMKDKKNTVFIASLVLTFLVTIWAVAFNGNFTVVSNACYSFLTGDFGWLYLLVMLAFVIISLIFAFSKWGNIRLGADDSKPEYSTFSWFAMLFGAGMGVGLVFWGISEPISHMSNPIPGIEPGSEDAISFALRSCFMHWGVHPWAGYAIIGLSLAYFTFRKNKPGLISYVFEPLIGEKGVKGWLGKTIDVLAVFATVAGVVTSLGLGVMQINAGFNYLFGIPSNLMVQIIIIVIISVIYIWSAVDGIGRGIKLIGDANLYIAIGLMIAVFVLGPRLEMLDNLTSGVGYYLQNFFGDSLMLFPYGDNSWVGSWRVFYWAWWIAWAPFVGSFIARISKGRTIREFVLGVVIVPALGSIVWFAIMGTLPIHLFTEGAMSLSQLAEIAKTPETGLFIVMGQYPLGTLLCVVSLVLLCTFFITSANSGTFVLAMFTTNGELEPPNNRKVLWGVLMSVLAVGLLMAGGLTPLQTISLAAAFPFIFIMVFAAIAFLKALKQEKV